MKKNLWILLALSALIAMFVISGCQKPVTPTPTPTPTATAQPTPTPDVKCPKVVSTEVLKYYYVPCGECASQISVGNAIYTNCYDSQKKATGNGYFKIVITFDENIDPLKSPCVYNPANWTIKVKNPDRLQTVIPNTTTNPLSKIWIEDVEIDGKKIIVTAGVVEVGSNIITPAYPTTYTVNYAFCGLICNIDDAKSYAKVVNGPFYGFPYAGVKAAPTVADEITWELSSSCVIADEQGNWCCGFSGKDCCVEPVCETCAPCPLEGSICQ